MQKKIVATKLEQAPTSAKIKTRTSPVFDDTEIGEIFNTIFYKRQKPDQLLATIILKTLFNSPNYKTAANELFEGVKNSKAVCAKVFSKNDIAFKCFDCEKDPTCVICKECYENGNHKGHRVLMQKSVSGCCDCGDPDAWNEKGFCCDHPGYANFKPTYSVDDIPAEFRENFLRVFEKCFFYLFNLYEEVKLCKQEDIILMNSLDDILKHIFGALEFCGEKSMALWLLICKLFRTKLSENNRELYADTTNLKEMSHHSISKPCNFTYFEALVFYQQLNSESLQNKIQNLCIKLFVDYDFKIYLAETYIKMIHFIFYTEQPEENKEGENSQSKTYAFTKLVGLDVQLFTAEEFSIIGINSEYFPAFLDLFDELLKYCVRSPNYTSYEVLMHFYAFLLYACQKTPSRKVLLWKEGAVKKILESLNNFNYCFKIDVTKKHNLNPGMVEDLVILLEIEYKLLQVVDNVFVELSLEENKAKRLEFAQDLAEYFVNTIKRNDIKAFKESKEFNKFRSIHIPYYRAFTLFVKDLVEEPTAAGLEKLLKVDLKISDRNIEIIFLFLFQITLRTLTFTIDNEKKIWEFYSPIFDIFSPLYKNPKLKLLDCDLLLLQYSLCFIHPEDFSMVLETSASVNPAYLELFKSINAGKFDESKFHKGVQEIQKSARRNSTADSVLNMLKRSKSMNTGEESGKADVALDEFFNLLVMLCTDQVSHANLFYQKTKMFENVKHPEFCQNVYKDLVINLMQKQTKMSFKAMREVLSKKVIHEKADIEGGLNEIATFDTQSKTFQLKDKYLNHYEPFAFLKDAQLLVETQETLKNRLKKDKTPCDLIVGNHSYVYQYRYSLLDKIQGRLFEFPIIEFAVNCFVQSHQISKTAGLITRPVLKLLHLALSYALHFKKHTLLTNLSKLLGTKEFADKLNELRDDTSCSELHPGIDKIIKLIAEVQQKSSVEGVEIVSPSINVDDKIKSNQEAIRQRMSQIKKDFSQKRDNFLKKFKEEIKEEEQATEENLVCYICHLNIGPDTEYGIPAFFSESSLYNLAFAQCKNRLKHKHTEEHKIEEKIEEPADEDDWESEDEEDVLEGPGSEASETREEEKVPEQPVTKRRISKTGKVPLEKKAFSPYPVVTSCSHNFHYIHKDCFEKSARKRTGSGSGFVFSNEMEYSCTFCKSLCNIFISENPSVFKPNEQEQEENIEVEIDDIKGVITTTEQLKQVPTNNLIVPDLVFNDVMLLQVFKEDQLKNIKNSSLTNEDHILVTFDKLLAQCCHTVIFGGLEYFIKYSFNLYKCLQSSYRQFYKAHTSSTKTQYFQNKKDLLIVYLGLLLSGESSEPLDPETDQLLFRDSPDSKIALFATPDEFIFDVLQHIVISSELTPKLESLFITKVLRIYLLHKIVQVYIKEKLSKDTKEQITLDVFLKDLTLGMNSPIKAELVNGILPTVRKIVVFILLNLHTPKETIDSLAKGDYLNDEEELNAYLKITCLNTTADTLFSANLFDYSGLSNEIVKAWIDGAQPHISRGIDSLTPYIMMADQEVMFTFTELPDNYYDLSMYYIEQKCQMCNNRSESGNQCVCLLCGMILCNFSCTKKVFSQTQRGNLNHHSIHYHAGESAFLNVESGTIFLIKTPKNVDYGPLYIDRLGYAIEEKGKDWRLYKVDNARLEILKEKFVCEKVAQEITYNIINSNKKYYDWTL